MEIGKVLEIWRYPVKSMGGERLERALAGARGITGDRGWAIRDEVAGEIRGAKHFPLLMQCSARYREEPKENQDVPAVEVTFPDGSCVGSDEPDVNDWLSALLNKKVSLWPLQPIGNKSHYKRAQPGAFLIGKLTHLQLVRRHFGSLLRLGGLETATREMFGREPGEPLPDFSQMPAEIFEFTSPPGTYFDLASIHLLTTASLAAMKQLNPTAAWDARRFRPNFLVQTSDNLIGLVEAVWSGRVLSLGELQLKCEIPTVRCGMTIHAQAELPKDPSVLRTIVREANQNLGIYASSLNLCEVNAGDQVVLKQ